MYYPNLQNALCLGVVGNMACHLAQAGEAADFAELDISDNAPKGLFAFYAKPPTPQAAAKNQEQQSSQTNEKTAQNQINQANQADQTAQNQGQIAAQNQANQANPSALSQINLYPISAHQILLARGFDADSGKPQILPTQVEPECFLIFDATYGADGELDGLCARYFGAFNDTSLRVQAPTISAKKNFSKASKGIANALDFTSFDEISSIRLSSFLRRDGTVHALGNEAFLGDYFYFGRELVEFVIRQIRTQRRQATLEPISQHLAARPAQILVSIGATSYTSFGQRCFLQDKDEILICLSREQITLQQASQAFDKAGEIDFDDASIGGFDRASAGDCSGFDRTGDSVGNSATFANSTDFDRAGDYFANSAACASRVYAALEPIIGAGSSILYQRVIAPK